MLLKNHRRPTFAQQEASQVAKKLYGLYGVPEELPSERDQNFHLTKHTGEEYVLKIAGAGEKREVLELQNQAMLYLKDARPEVRCPHVVKTTAGDLIGTVKDSSGADHFVSLVTYLPGKVLAKVKPHSQELLQQLGAFLGRLDMALSSFSHPAAQREFYWDLKNAPAVLNDYSGDIPDREQREMVQSTLARFERTVVPELPNLRTSVIHHDANDYNVIVDRCGSDCQATIGLIDFGDMVHSCTVFELAVGCAYAMLGKADPLAAACAVVRGYHAVLPLTELEIELLFTLICARLAMSVTIAARQQKDEPDNTYLKISEEPAWDLLDKLKEVHPRFATYALREACDFLSLRGALRQAQDRRSATKQFPSPAHNPGDCFADARNDSTGQPLAAQETSLERSNSGLAVCPQSQAVVEWLKGNPEKIGPVLPVNLRTAPCLVFDLSVGSPEIGDLAELADTEAFTDRLFARMKAEGATVGVGRYNEARLCYTAEQFNSEGNEREELRTIHLGIDLFVQAGTQVLAPLDGRIHSFQNNSAPLDYGPTIILEHSIADGGPTFYTLYGHLGEDSLVDLKEGQPVKNGDTIGKIGDATVNGGWPPHLHFQLICDLLDQKGDFPGVALPSQREIWLSLCPDPNVILGIPGHLFPKPCPSKSEILKSRAGAIGKSLSISYKNPLQIVRGYMQYLFDENGQRHLDAVNNVPHVGHSHPRVVKRLQEQAAVLNTNTRYLHEKLVEYADRLCARMPDPLNVCYFVCSGSEANELALRLARTHTGQRDVIVVDGAYHGNTGALVEISPYKFDGPGGQGAAPHVHKVVMPDGYRGPYKAEEPQAGKRYAAHVLQVIEDVKKRGRKISAFICESLLGCGGQIVLPDYYLREAFSYVHEAGGVCIADEVQVGFGRVGTHFWGFETQGVVPDIVTLGKPIGNGHPLAAVITTQEIADSFNNGMEYFNTFGGNPVSCSVGMAVLDVIADEGLQENARRVGVHLKVHLERLKPKHSLIGDVRGLGLFVGIELVRNRETLEPAAEQASYIVERMRDHGILISTDGPLHNVLKIKPPMVFSKENADFFVQSLDKILAEDFVCLN